MQLAQCPFAEPSHQVEDGTALDAEAELVRRHILQMMGLVHHQIAVLGERTAPS
jgi:hypothetical protein